MSAREEDDLNDDASDDLYDEAPGGGSLFFLVSGLLISLGVLGVGLSLQPPKSNGTSDLPEIAVHTLVANRSQAIEVTRSFSGLLEPRRESQLGFGRGGVVTQILVEEGEEVTAGQVLARLDVRRITLQKTNLETALKTAREQRDELVEITPADAADVRKKLQELRTELNRLDQMFPAGQPSPPNSESFLNRLAAIERRIQALEGPSGKGLANAEKRVKELESQLEDVTLQLEEGELKAPFEGVLTARHKSEGAVVSAGMPVFHLVEQAALVARVGVPNDLASELQIDDSLSVLTDGASAQGKISAILPNVSKTARTRTVVVALDRDATPQVAPGQLARVEIRRRLSENGYWLPMSALTRESRGLWSIFVAVEEEGGAHLLSRRYVELVHVESRRVFVRGSIEAGDLVVADGLHRVTPGQRVRPQDVTDAYVGSAQLDRTPQR